MSESVITPIQGFVILITFWIISFLAIIQLFRKKTTSGGFLVSERKVGNILGPVTVAIAWIWAPALFVSSQKSFEQGLPGLFWFTLPNALTFVLFAFLASRMREIFSEGYTLPEYIGKRFDRKTEILYTVAIFVAQAYAIIVNLTGALLMLNLVTGINRQILVIVLGTMMVSLSMLKGIRSSLVQDSIKAALVLIVAFVITPWVIASAGGISSITNGIGGVSGKFANLFDPVVAWTFGVPISISLFSGFVIDQQQWQRAFSMRKNIVKQSFLLGGVIFAFIPLCLGLLGFVAANNKLGVSVSQNQLAGFSAVINFLPEFGVIAFVGMILAGLVAAGSAALAAISSIWAIDVYRFINRKPSEATLINVSRASMILFIVIGMTIALIPNIQILYLLLIVGVFRASLFLPTILSLYWSKLSTQYTFWGIILGMLTGVPLFVYGSLTKNATISSFGSLVPLIITLIVCGLSLTNNKKFDFLTLSKKKSVD